MLTKVNPILRERCKFARNHGGDVHDTEQAEADQYQGHGFENLEALIELIEVWLALHPFVFAQMHR